ncbi:MAG: hypothetical protein LBT90_03310 [Holosporaceae bacterium]|jgi:hypothetical protein|nr:hypothetical protein [Holosporaceae bacterium]
MMGFGIMYEEFMKQLKDVTVDAGCNAIAMAVGGVGRGLPVTPATLGAAAAGGFVISAFAGLVKESARFSQIMQRPEAHEALHKVIPNPIID